MTSLKSLNNAKAELLDAQQKSTDMVLSLSTKRSSDVSESIIKTQTRIHDRISKILQEISKIEGLVMNANGRLMEHKDLLKKFYRYVPPKNYGNLFQGAAEKALEEVWRSMNTPDASQYKLMVCRISPQIIDGQQAMGYLKTYHLPITIPEIIEQVGEEYGTGKYQIRIVSGEGKFIKSKTFDASCGASKLGDAWQEDAELRKKLGVEPVYCDSTKEMRKVLDKLN